jgi:hypothetical protein
MTLNHGSANMTEITPPGSCTTIQPVNGAHNLLSHAIFSTVDHIPQYTRIKYVSQRDNYGYLVSNVLYEMIAFVALVCTVPDLCLTCKI